MYRFLPFLRWLPYSGTALRADFFAGLTVALVIVPQSMAYAQLAGLPAYYGLYAAFLPVMVGALWGSSNQLGTGPVAVASLLTASSLAPLAAPGSEHFVALAIMLALMVGIVQLVLGVFKLGVIVNFLSHPVIVGFTNAAAMIIGLSQVNKLIGVPMGRSEHFIQDIWGVVRQAGDTHWPTLAMGATAIAIMWAIRRKAPKLPGVLIAVTLTTTASWLIGFENNVSAPIAAVMEPEARTLLEEFDRAEVRIGELNEQIAAKGTELKAIKNTRGDLSHEAVTLNYEVELLKLQLKDREDENRRRNRAIRSFVFERVAGGAPGELGGGAPGELGGDGGRYYAQGKLPPGTKGDGHYWRIAKAAGNLKFTGGGEVVSGAGRAALHGHTEDVLDMLGSLISAAFVISLVGYGGDLDRQAIRQTSRKSIPTRN